MNSGRKREDEQLAKREDPYNVTQASRIYFWPNLMTAGNLFCGFLAVINCIQARLAESAASGEYLGWSAAEHYRYAVYLIIGAAVFDSLDGRLARMGGRESLFGAEFDSLADIVSFGIAPALLMFYLILSPTQGYLWFREIGWFVGFVYLLCAAVRLPREIRDQQGLRRPAGAGGGRYGGLGRAFLTKAFGNGSVVEELGAFAPVSDVAGSDAHGEHDSLSKRQDGGSSDQDAVADVHFRSALHRIGDPLQRDRICRDVSGLHFLWSFPPFATRFSERFHTLARM